MRSRILAFVSLLLAWPAFAQTTTYLLSPVAHQQFLDSNGKPLAGGKLWTYLAGTTTPVNTYANSTGTLNRNPITVDSGGFTPQGLFLDSSKSYKYVLTNGLGSAQWTMDGISAAGGGGTGANWDSPPALGDVTPNTVDGTVVTAQNRFVGPLTGNVTGNVSGSVTGNGAGNVTGNVTGSAGSVPINGLTAATASNAIDNAANAQTWEWEFTGSVTQFGLSLSESTASTNTNPNTSLLSSITKSGSTVNPFQAIAANTNGVRVTSAGNLVTLGSASFVGPLSGNATSATTATTLTGYQAGKFGPTCSTPAGVAYGICTTTYTFASAIGGSLTSLPIMYGTAPVSNSAFSITIILGNGTTSASAPNVYCMFYHP